MIETLQDAVSESQTTPIKFPVDWLPRDDQMNLWKYLVNGGKRAVSVCHRRWGKDEIGLRWASCAMLEQVGNYWHMLPEYGQARKVIWSSINPKTQQKRIDEVFPHWIRKNTKEQEMSIEFVNGSLWQLVGSDNYNSLVGAAPVGIVFSEWAIANPLAWPYLSPILEENGGWALFIFTPRGTNHGFQMLKHAQVTEGWFGQVLPADQTGIFSPGQLEKIKQDDYVTAFGVDLGEALFQQEYLCSFEGAQLGAYYGKQLTQARKDGRICSVPWTPTVEVHTFWDLGVDDSMTIWFMQQVGKEYRLIDYYENTGYGLEHYANILKNKRYTYGNHYMPHDADVREMSSGEIALTRKEVAEGLGINPVIVVQRAQNINVIMQVHIPAVRNIMAQCWWDEKKCEIGLNALEAYKAEYDEEKKVLSNRPEHNWASHGCFTSETYLLTKYGKCQIMELPNEGEVMTLCGWKPYKNPRVTRRDVPLVEVVFSDGHSVRCTPDHFFLTENGWKFAKDLSPNTVIQSSLTNLHNILMVVYTEFGRAKNTTLVEAKSYIETFGDWLLEKFRKVAISIIGMGTLRIIDCQTLSVNHPPNIYQMGGIKQRRVNVISRTMHERRQANGINQMQADSGIADMHNDQNHGRNGKEKRNPALYALKNLWHWFVKAVIPKFIALHIVSPLHVINVISLNQIEDVWCLTVPEIKHFSLMNGAVVRNSDAFRTFAVGYTEAKKDQDWRKKLPKGSWRST